MQFKVVTNKAKETKQRDKKTPEIARNIIEQVNAKTNEVTTIQVIKDVFNGVENNIPVTSMYVDSHGDLVKISRMGNSVLVETEMCEESLKHIEALCDMNISDDRNSSGITRRRIQFEGNEIDVCQITLGTYRNYIEKNNDFINLGVKQKRIPIPKLNADGEVIPDSFTYESRIMCLAENKDEVIRLIRKLNKTVIEWF